MHMLKGLLLKILILVLSLSVIPLLLFTLISFVYLGNIENTSRVKINDLGTFAVKQSTDSLTELGQEIIKEQAVATAKMVDLYMAAHPNKTAAELAKDEAFGRLSVQRVGETGYTVTVEGETLRLIRHQNEALNGVLFSEVPGLKAPTFDTFWKILEKTKELKETSGYYNWLEKDGRITQKYLHTAFASSTTADGRHIGVAATTYINEFTQPVSLLQNVLDEKNKSIIAAIVSTKTMIIWISLLTSTILFVVVVLLSVFFSKKITDPLRELTEAGEQIAKGKLDTALPQFKTGDEIEILARALEAMRVELASEGVRLGQLVQERTKELEHAQVMIEEKLGETERLNELMIDRELKMTELKSEIASLKKVQQ